MTTRRAFLASVLAAGTLPALSWANAGSPDWLSAARNPDGSFALYGMTLAGAQRFRIPLPARGHAAAAHPDVPEAIAFARRPGRFALVLDCVNGRILHRLDAPEGRHFYGHGCFSADGAILFTTENRIEDGAGRIALWARDRGYARLGEIPSGGIGPHDILRLPGSDVLVVANGGIQTHPNQGRDKLNLDTMRPNLSYLSADAGIMDQIELEPELRQNSIRHLVTGPDETVAFAMQWQGDDLDPVPLLGLHRRGTAPLLVSAPEAEQRAMQGYAGSVALDPASGHVAISSPRGGRVHVFDADGRFLAAHLRADICGLGAAPGGFIATDGMGGVSTIGQSLKPRKALACAWDNHLIRL